jgi:uracil-DNA glycosylase family 4
MTSQALTILDEKPSFCSTCPNLAETCLTQGTWDSRARITVVGESPSEVSLELGAPFAGPNGDVLHNLFKAIHKEFKDQLPAGEIRYSKTYASGTPGKPTQEVITKCAELWKNQWVAQYAQGAGVHVVVPFGLPAAKSVGVTAKKIMDIRGRVQTRMLGNRQVIVVPTLSLASVYAKPGLGVVVGQDLKRAVQLAYLDVYTPPKSIEELSKDYRFPRTLDEVKSLCDEIIAYRDPAKPTTAEAWPISIDTETNTVKPFRRDAKVLIISFGWDDGKAGAILLDHPENTFYDPQAAWAEVGRVLACSKPKVFHNAKFDLQFLERVYNMPVNNVDWDTMCGEHWISEDQKGVYGLKALSPTYAPEYEGYEETLHQALRDGEETVPTEEDALKEARELAAAAGGGGDQSWMETFEEPEKEEEKEEVLLSNEKWLQDPEWSDLISEEQKVEYRKARDEWFLHDAAGNGKARGSTLRRWKKLAKAFHLPTPEPVRQKEIAKQERGFAHIGLDVILPYAAADADLTRLILKKQYRKLVQDDVLATARGVMHSLYLPGSRSLGGLEFRGAKINLKLARAYDTELAQILNDTQTRIYNLACQEFKILASQQLAVVLRNMGFAEIKKTAKEAMSVSKEVLVAYQKQLVDRMTRLTDPQQVADDTRRLEFIEAVLLYRTAQKMKQSFLRRIREYAALDGHIHTTFHLTGTSTGRLSSARLNLQNLPLYMCRITRPNPDDPENPIVIQEGFNVKALLIPESDDEVFWNLDIKAAEIRVACYYSQDPSLIEAVRAGLDIHTFILTRVKHPSLSGEELNEQYKQYFKLYKSGDRDISTLRGAIKRVVFGTLYGAGPTKIAAQIGGNYTKEQAKELIEALFTMFPGLRAYVKNTKKKVEVHRKVMTIFGRYRRFALSGVSSELRAKAEREAVNSLIQSTSSDLVLAQLCEIDEHLHEIEATMRLTVHDSMAGTIKKTRVKEMKAFFDKWLVERVKERFPWLPVPFLFDLEVGPSYGEKMSYKDWLLENNA